MRNLEFDSAAFDDLAWWVQKPEPLKHELAGCWSRRIDQEHRLVYQIKDDLIRIISARRAGAQELDDYEKNNRFIEN